MIDKIIGVGKVILNRGVSLKASFLSGEIKNNITTTSPYGLASKPPIGQKMFCLFFNNRTESISISCEQKEEIINTLKDGECCLFENVKNLIKFTDGNASIVTSIFFVNNVDILKTLQQLRLDLDSLKTTYESHTHANNGASTPISPTQQKPEVKK